MEEQTSGNDTALLFKLKALARRGTVLRRTPCGGGVVGQQDCQPEAGNGRALQFRANEIATALREDWLTERAGGEFALSKRAASLLRIALSRPDRCARPSTRTHAAGDPARHSRAAHQPERTTRPGHAAFESPLAWLRRHGSKTGKELISAAEFDAGERLRGDFELAQMRPRVTASWDLATPAMRQRRAGPDAALQTSEAAVAARQRVEAALNVVGPEGAGVLIDVCCFLTGIEQAERNGGWPRRAGKVVLKMALAQLVRHYGIGAGDGPSRGRILHWGADGYRPDIDGTELDKAG
jgi:hypothetical protein